ncbi:universal stress protein [Kitasatospora sp. NPDC056531]|uniref:universal stress protein n=1 Tax=Kitasatospora sp. NPDC056531 TaxID=3345856 RepID=UPI0036A66E7C
MTDPVVVGVDGSERSLRALVWAAGDAARRGCPLLIAHVLPGWEADFPFFPPGRAQGLSRRGAEILAEAVAIAKESHPGLEVESDQVPGSPAEVLRDASERARCMVLGARSEGGLGNLLMGSVSLQVAGHAACPVVVVGAITTGHGQVLVGTDGSEHSAAALEFAFEEASLRGDRVHALRAWSMPITPEPSEAGPSPDAVESDHRRQLDDQLAPLRQRYPGVEVETTLVRGKPVAELVRASDRADLAVVGSRGKGGFHGLALGSVSHGLLHYGICPIAVVRPRPRHTPPS